VVSKSDYCTINKRVSFILNENIWKYNCLQWRFIIPAQPVARGQRVTRNTRQSILNENKCFNYSTENNKI